jgi:hypothetical protein
MGRPAVFKAPVTGDRNGRQLPAFRRDIMSGTGSITTGQQSAQASGSMDAMMGQMEAQNMQQMKNNLAMGRMSQEAAMSEALGKKFKAAGDSVKGLV